MLRIQRPITNTLARHQAIRRSFSQTLSPKKTFPALVQEIKATNKNIHLLQPKELHALFATSATTKTAAASTQPSTVHTSGNAPHVVDVREKGEVEATGTIPGAIALPRGILERDISKFIPQDDPRDVVVYCAGGFRSILAAESLVRLGYGQQSAASTGTTVTATRPKVWSLEEGIDGWISHGYEVEKKL